MSIIKVLGVDLGKSCFHLIGRDQRDHIVFRKKVSRQKLAELISQLPSCLIAFEACGGAHWLARQCQQHGHQVRLIPPQYVKPYVKGNKNDFIDAAAISEAALRPDMRLVSVKTEASQVMAACHRLREGYVKERTTTMSRISAILLEFGVSLPKGHATMKALFCWLAQQRHLSLPKTLMIELQEAHDHYCYLNQRIALYRIRKSNPVLNRMSCACAWRKGGVIALERRNRPVQSMVGLIAGNQAIQCGLCCFSQ